MNIALVILAAGQGTRMNSELPKVLHPIAGAPMFVHAMQAGASVCPETIVIVAGHGADQVTKLAKQQDETAQIVLQTEQLGTAHAVAQARPALDGFQGDVIVLMETHPSSGLRHLIALSRRAPPMIWSCWVLRPPILNATGA